MSEYTEGTGDSNPYSFEQSHQSTPAAQSGLNVNPQEVPRVRSNPQNPPTLPQRPPKAPVVRISNKKLTRTKSASSTVLQSRPKFDWAITTRNNSVLDPYNAGGKPRALSENDGLKRLQNRYGELEQSPDFMVNLKNDAWNEDMPTKKFVESESVKLPVLPSQPNPPSAGNIQDKGPLAPNSDAPVASMAPLSKVVLSESNKESAPLSGQSQSIFNETLLSSSSPSRNPTVLIKKKLKLDSAMLSSPFMKSSDFGSDNYSSSDVRLGRTDTPDLTPMYQPSTSFQDVRQSQAADPKKSDPPLPSSKPGLETAAPTNDVPTSPPQSSQQQQMKPISSSILYPLKYPHEGSSNKHNPGLFKEITTAVDEDEADEIYEQTNSLNTLPNSISPSVKINVKSSSLPTSSKEKGKSKKYCCWFALLISIIFVLIGGLVPSIYFSIKGSPLAINNFIADLAPEKRNQLFSSLQGRFNLSSTPSSEPSPESTILMQPFRTQVPTDDPKYIARVSNSLHDEGSRLNGVNSFENISPEFQKNQQIKHLMNLYRNGTLFYGLAYSPHNALEPDCGLTQEDVILDLSMLSTVTTRIRTYGVQCKQAEYALQAIDSLNLNMTIAMGVWIGSNDSVNEQQLSMMKTLLRKYPARYFNTIYVGNEVLFREDKTLTQMIEYIKKTKEFLKSIGKASIPVGTSEIGSLINHQLVAACDVIGANIHPFFGGGDVSFATNWTYDFVKEQIEPILAKVEGEDRAKIVITEVGWPFKGGKYQSSKADAESFQQFLDEYICEAYKQNYAWYFFEAFDEPWKRIFYEGNNRWETEWGVFTHDRKIKAGISFPRCG